MKISLPLSLITGPECAKVSGDGGSHIHTTRQIVVIFVFELFDFFIIREWDACILPCRYSNGYDMAGPWILSVPYVHRLPIIMFVLADSTKRMERWLIDYGFIVWRSARARLDKCRSSSSSTLEESILLLWHLHIDTFLVIMRVLFVDFCRFYFISSVAHYFCLKHLKKKSNSTLT